jgi:hypothetical protein
MADPVLIAIVTTSPAAAGVAWKIFSELKKIAHAVNGELEAKFAKVHGRLDDIAQDVRDVKAEHREVKAELREYRSHLAGDGK